MRVEKECELRRSASRGESREGVLVESACREGVRVEKECE